jgi:transposase
MAEQFGGHRFGGGGALTCPHLPRGKPGKPRVDDRTVISGILHVLKTG